MYPYLLPEVFGYTIVMYDMMIVIGVIAMLIYVINRFEKNGEFTRAQTNRLVILIVISLLFALLSSYLVDGIFHSIQEGELTFGSITFIGGLVGGIAAFLILTKYFYKDDNKDMKKIMNIVIVGVVLAHAFGRVGCYLAGCCFGIPTESFLGVVFPHGHASHVYPGTTVFPTQLFEAFYLFVLFGLLSSVKKFKGFEIEAYVIGYGIWRIMIEFIRGDDRGSLFTLFTTQYNVFPTPSQFLSLIMVIFGVFLLIRRSHTNTPIVK